MSSDAFFYSLGDRFWRDGPQKGIQDTARAFGLGSDTGIPLPYEQSGFVPDADTMKAEVPQRQVR